MPLEIAVPTVRGVLNPMKRFKFQGRFGSGSYTSAFLAVIAKPENDAVGSTNKTIMITNNLKDIASGDESESLKYPAITDATNSK